MSEYHQNVGRRVELRQDVVKLKISIASHRESLRLALDPAAEPEDLDAEKIVTLAAALGERVVDLQEVKAKIAVIEKIIGQ